MDHSTGPRTGRLRRRPRSSRLADTSGSARDPARAAAELQGRRDVRARDRSPDEVVRRRASTSSRSSPPPFRSTRSPVSGPCSERKAKISSSVPGSPSSSRCEWPRTSVRSGRRGRRAPPCRRRAPEPPRRRRSCSPGRALLRPMPDPEQRAVSSQERELTARSAAGTPRSPAAGRELEDHPVGDPLDGRTVVRPRVGRRQGHLQVPCQQVRKRPKLSGAARKRRTRSSLGSARSRPITNWLKRGPAR